jgi:hypothetical protein
MPPRKIKARLDAAMASADPAAAVESAARALVGEGFSQYRLFRLLQDYWGGLREPWAEPIERSLGRAIDLAWGAPWVEGRRLFELPLCEAAAREALLDPFTVREVAKWVNPLDGRFVRVRGRLQLCFEISALQPEPVDDPRHSGRWSLAWGGCVGRWLKLLEFEGRPPTGMPPAEDWRARALWFDDTFNLRRVEVVAAVDARDRGHLSCRKGGLFAMSLALVGDGAG